MRPSQKKSEAKHRQQVSTLFLGAAVAVSLLVMNIALALRNTRQLNEDASWVAHTHEVIGRLEHVLSLAKDAETGQRGFVISGDQRYLKPYDTAVDRINETLDEIATLTADNPRQQATIPALKEHVAAKLTELGKTIGIMKSDGFEVARQAVVSDRGRKEMDALRAVVGQMVEHEHDLLRDRSQASEHTYRVAIVSGLLSGVAGLTAVGAFIVLMTRHLAVRAKASLIIAEQGERWRTTLASIGDAVIATDFDGRITSMNAIAESLTGWKFDDATGQPLDTVFRIVNEDTRQTVESPAARALYEGVIVGLANHTVLLSKDGAERPIDDSAAPIRCKDGEIVGCVLVFRDVTDRRTTEVLLKESERQFHTLADSIPQLAWMAKPDGHIFWYNRRWYDYTGTTFDQMEGWGWQSVHDPKVLPSVLEKWNSAIASGQAFEMVFPLKGKDGTFRTFLTLIEPLLDQEGRLVQWFGTNTDITEAERFATRERFLLGEASTANAKFRAFFDQGPLFAGIMTLDGTIIEPNRLSLEACGYTRDQVVGKPFWDCPWWNGSATLMDQIREATAQAVAGQTYRAEMPYFVADGSERVVDLVVLPIKGEDGEVLFLAPTGTDVTDRRRAEDDRQKFVTLAETITDFIGMCDLQGTPFFVNKAGLKMVGLNEHETLQGIALRDFFFPEDQTKILDEFLPSVLKEGHGEIEVRFRNFQTGNALWMLYKVVALVNSREECVGLATVSRDITQRRELENNLRQLASDLSEANHRKDEFLATLAHELRNPLAPIRNGLQLMKLADGDNDTMEKARALMERQVAQMVRLVDDLLDVSRITRGKIDLRRERVDIASIIQQAVETSRPAIESSRQQLTVNLPPQPVYLDADPVRLAQVFSNLLNNSGKYSEPGGRISIKAERQGAEAVISVKDTGIGIPPDMLPRIFEMFTQIDRSLDRSDGGLGIGLTLVQRLVELHNGSVRASSAGTGKGSEFVVRLPIADESPAPSPQPSIGEPKLAIASRILVVDDNRDSASSLAMLLKAAGNDTQIAHDGLAAVEMADFFRPDVVLLDIGLPRLNGYEVARKIREQAWGKGMVLVALTGWGQDEDRRKSKEAGFNGHMVKPVGFAALVKLLNELLSKPG
jgi:PAS domain S-box-containing protein